jgi:hypothetical protein
LLQLLLGTFYFSGLASFPVRFPRLLLFAGHLPHRWWNAVATTVLSRLLLGLVYFSGFAMFPVRFALLVLLAGLPTLWRWNAVATHVLQRLLLGSFCFPGFAMLPGRPSLLLLLPSVVSRWRIAAAATVLWQLRGRVSMLARWLTLRVATGKSRFAAAAACGCYFNPRWYLSLGFELSLHALSCI